MAEMTLCSLIVVFFFAQSSSAIKCFDCNSANNSACLDLNLQRMRGVVPIVDCARAAAPGNKQFFCRKITQTILHTDKTPEVRITRGCGWVKHKRECYTADNKDHLETVCQCFGDMCNAAPKLSSRQSFAVAVVSLVTAARWR